jgi:hypothetical protein
LPRIFVAISYTTTNTHFTSTRLIRRDTFVTECPKMLFWKFLLRRIQAGTFFPGINIINISPSPTEFWATLCVPELTFFRKIALLIIILKKNKFDLVKRKWERKNSGHILLS